MSHEQAEALDREIRSEVRRFREIQVGLGRKLLRVRRNDLVLAMGATTFAICAEKVGLSAQEGWDLADIAEGAERRPEVEARVAEGRISVQKAATVAEVLRKPELQRPGEDWLLKAEQTTTFDLRRMVQKRNCSGGACSAGFTRVGPESSLPAQQAAPLQAPGGP